MLIKRIKAARSSGVPLVWITTPDQPAMLARLRAGWNGTPAPMLRWDSAAGLRPLNKAGEDIVAALLATDPSLAYNLAACLGAIDAEAPDDTLVVVSMADAVLKDDRTAQQAVVNVRDAFKATHRTLICLSEGVAIPSVLHSDFLTLEEQPPDAERIRAIITQTLDDARGAFDFAEPDDATTDHAITSLIGLHSFPIEQAIALSLRERGALVDDDLQERKRAIVRQIPGLSMPKPDLPLDCLGGLSQIKQYARHLFAGKRRPTLIVILEELEKAIGASTTESSGTTADQVAVMLTAMEDKRWGGLIAVGPPGSGKSQFAKSLGPTYGAPVMVLDLGNAKGSLVGESEAKIRNAVATISTMGGAHVMFVASCNALQSVPPPLRRRFTHGVWYFDLPNAEERANIWHIQLTAYALPLDAPRPDDTGWTGAEIRNCCEMADSFGVTPAEAAQYIAPVSQSDPESITKLRGLAVGRWLNASAPGRYTLPESGRASSPAGRRFQE